MIVEVITHSKFILNQGEYKKAPPYARANM